jgi:hypothetical protein
MPSRRETEEILRANLDRAVALYTQARTEFDAVLADLPSDLPVPDGALRIRKAGSAHNPTLRAVNEARINLHNFTTWGYAPDGYVDADSFLAESNRNTLKFIERSVAFGWTFLQSGILESDRDANDRSLRDAQKACERARRFLERVYSLVPGERESLHYRLEDLQAAIEQFRNISSTDFEAEKNPEEAPSSSRTKTANA